MIIPFKEFSNFSNRQIRKLGLNSLVTYARKWGASPRRLISIASGAKNEKEYTKELELRLSKVFQGDVDISALTGTVESPSDLFFVRPSKDDPTSPETTVPTQYLMTMIGKAFLKANVNRRLAMFEMLHMHPATRCAAGWIFEGLAHHTFSNMQQNVTVYWNGKPPTETPLLVSGVESISGRDCLKHRSGGEKFYWQPAAANFPTIDAILYDGETLYLLQLTVAEAHKMNPTGLNLLDSYINKQLSRTSIPWKFVFVGYDPIVVAGIAAKAKLPEGWGGIAVGYCVLEVSRFGSWVRFKTYLV